MMSMIWISPSLFPSMIFSDVRQSNALYAQDVAPFKDWICIYPIYFDANVSIHKGRKVKKAWAIKNPNVIHLMYAIHKLSFKTCFEPVKRHPRTFDNYGRIRVNLLLENGFYANQDVTTKHQLLQKIANLLPEAQRSIGEVDSSDLEAVVNAGKKYLRVAK
ncbi:signal recognition particle subunit [Entomophthora muscae]|uniref:Signal recognition particle subunit n=1 Tax=Entomophthora muscae TaxID=34485 RepID=A0ACC2TBI0_9FUNG|nr:signal recognition particle subunit [Entomophthora muscae]